MKIFKIIKKSIAISILAFSAICPSLVFSQEAFLFNKIDVPLPAGAIIDNFYFQESGVAMPAIVKATTSTRQIIEVAYHLESSPNERHNILVGFDGSSVEILLDLTSYFNSKAGYFHERKYITYNDKVLIIAKITSPDWDIFIWETDGTTVGTKLIVENYYDPTKAASEPSKYVPIRANDIQLYGDKLLYHDQIEGGLATFNLKTQEYYALPKQTPYLAKDLFSILDLRTNDGKLMLVGDDNSLYTTDGTEAGTTIIVPNLMALPEEENLSTPIPVGNKIFIVPIWTAGDRTYFVTDGTEHGTHRIAASLVKYSPTSFFSNPIEYSSRLQDRVFYIKSSELYGVEFWALDLRTLQAGVIKDINPGPASSNIREFFNSTKIGKIVFIADDGVHGRELWVSDGTPDGTTLLKDILPGSQSGIPIESDSDLISLEVNSTKLFFRLPDKYIWVTDGTTNGTHRVDQIRAIDPIFYAPVRVLVDNLFIYASQKLGVPSINFYDDTLSQFPSAYDIKVAGMRRLNDDSSVVFGGLAGSHLVGTVRTRFRSESEPSGVFYRTALISTDLDQCPDDDRKIDPGVCGCGVEEQPLISDGKDRRIEPGASLGPVLCFTDGGPIEIDLEDIDSVTFKSNDRSPARANANFILQMPKKLGFTARQYVAAAKVGRKSSLPSNLKVRHKLKLYRYNIKTQKASLITEKRIAGKSASIRLARKLKANERLVYSYGYELESKSSKKTLLTTPVLRTGEVGKKSSSININSF